MVFTSFDHMLAALQGLPTYMQNDNNSDELV